MESKKTSVGLGRRFASRHLNYFPKCNEKLQNQTPKKAAKSRWLLLKWEKKMKAANCGEVLLEFSCV